MYSTDAMLARRLGQGWLADCDRIGRLEMARSLVRWAKSQSVKNLFWR